MNHQNYNFFKRNESDQLSNYNLKILFNLQVNKDKTYLKPLECSRMHSRIITILPQNNNCGIWKFQ